jgi:ATP-dependent Clp protease ATP-binding subunit ClpB
MSKAIAELHQPVALKRTLEILGEALCETGAGKVLVDCTLGLGGHSEAFLDRFSELTLIGIDRDPNALELAGKRLARFGGLAILVHAVYDDIAEVVAKWTGIPVSKMLESEKQKILRMEEELRKRVVGQGEAITAVCNAVKRSQAGLHDPKKPIGAFLFLGPTGVGKTETAKALAQFLFDDEANMVRIDMSEFMEKHSVSRLVGAPPGYVGYEEGGLLTEAVRRRPYSVVLFDEVEKAHPDVFNILLQVLDDGILTSGQGTQVNFKNTIIILTSNLGTQHLQAEDEISPKIREKVMQEVRGHFRPEFLNRLDDIILFHPLTKSEITHIVDIQLESVKQLLEARNLSMVVDQKAKEILADRGYDPTYGARPLKRLITELILNPLSEKILEGAFKGGDSILATGNRQGELEFHKEK